MLSPYTSPIPMRFVRARRNPSTPRVSVLGIDASLTSTGYAYRDEKGQVVAGTIPTGELRSSHRLLYVQNKITRLLDLADPVLVVIEGYAMGFGGGKGNPGRVFDIGELGGVVKLAVWQRGIDAMIVPPSTLKCVIADNGKAKKPEMITALRTRYGHSTVSHDEADAIGLMLTGEIRCGKTKLVAKPSRMGSIEACEVIRGQLKLISKQHTTS